MEAYLTAAKRAGLMQEDRKFVALTIAANPQAGNLVKGSNGVRKVRIAKPDTGKSGGWRVLTAYVGDDAPVFLLAIYAKNQRASITKAEVNALAKLVAAIKEEVRSRTK